MSFLYEHTNGICFRKADIHDANELLQLKNESWFGTHTITLANLTSQEKWLESISCETHCPKDLVLIANISTSSAEWKCGIFKLFNIDWQSRCAEAGWDIFATFRKQGYGKKLVLAGVAFAFQVLNIRRLNAQILATNEASIKCAENARFKIEGRQKEAIYKNGKYVDNLLYGITYS
jgi:RimJ/RimL family protein N-acetyltransferase